MLSGCAIFWAVAVMATSTFAVTETGSLHTSVYSNAMLIEPLCTVNTSVGEGGVLVPFAGAAGTASAPCAPPAPSATASWGVRWDGILSGGKSGDLVTMAVNVTGAVRLWVHQWKVVEVWDATVFGATHIARYEHPWGSFCMLATATPMHVGELRVLYFGRDVKQHRPRAHRSESKQHFCFWRN
jgi:hypothetical protein